MCRLFVTQGLLSLIIVNIFCLLLTNYNITTKKYQKKNVTNTMPFQYSKIGYYSSGTKITHFDTEATIRKCFPKIGVLKNFAVFIKQQLCRSHF